jgi:hypothetical protein
VLDFLFGLLRFVDGIFGGLSNMVDCRLDGLLDFAGGLVGFAFVAKFVVSQQRSGSFLDPAFNFLRFATHDEIIPLF